MVPNPAPRGPNGLRNPFWRVLGGQPEKNTFLKASRTPQGPLLGSYLGAQNRCKAVMEALPRRNWYRRAFWNGSGTSWIPIFECFFKSSWAKMISNTDYSDGVKILKNTSVFTVKLHLRNVANAEKKLPGTLFVSISDWCTSESVSGPPPGLDMGAIWEPKIDPKEIWKPSGKVSNFEPRI